MHVISFGQFGYYEELSIDLLERIKLAYPNDNFMVYNQFSLPNELIKYASRYSRGYGYWRWKPYIILQHLEHMIDDEILLYVDGRSHFESNNIFWLDQFLLSEQFDLCVWKGSLIENRYTIKQVFELFGLKQDSPEVNSGQIGAGVIAIRKRQCTISLLEKWNSLLTENPELFRDDFNQMDQIEDFIENRHDQSAFSLLVKTSKCETLFLTDKDFNRKNSIFTQFKFHNSKYSFMKNRIRFFFGIGFGYKVFTFGFKILFKIKRILRFFIR
jgi:hypothetical protein